MSTSSMDFRAAPFRLTSCTSTKTPRLAARGAFLWAISVTGVLVFGLVEHLFGPALRLMLGKQRVLGYFMYPT
jgi:hypothetical protein